MCYHKSFVVDISELLDHYSASFNSITAELDPIRERFTLLSLKDEWLSTSSLNEANPIGERLIQYSQKDALPATLTKPELSELKWCFKTLTGFDADGVRRYYENGFDYLPTPIITVGAPEEFKLFTWGLIPFFMSDREKAMQLRTSTLNCVSEEMYNTPSYREAAKNAQRCLIPVSGFYEWRWLDEKGTVKIPYYVTFRDQKVRSMAGLYSRWKDKTTDHYHYTYTVLTTRANTILEYVHNNKMRMPVFIGKENEKDWLNKDLSKDDVLNLCQPSKDPDMRAYTVSKLLTTRNINNNVPAVRNPMNYEAALQEAHRFLQAGDKKKALEAFKNSISGQQIKLGDLENVAGQEILAELEF